MEHGVWAPLARVYPRSSHRAKALLHFPAEAPMGVRDRVFWSVNRQKWPASGIVRDSRDRMLSLAEL